MLRREDGHILRKALDFEVEGQRKKSRLKRTWKRQVEEENTKVGLRRKDALCCSKWSVGINKIAAGLSHPHLLGILNIGVSLSLRCEAKASTYNNI